MYSLICLIDVACYSIIVVNPSSSQLLLSSTTSDKLVNVLQLLQIIKIAGNNLVPSSLPSFIISEVKMYLNPVSNQLSIDANGEIQKVSVYNLLGKEVLTKKPNSNNTTLQTSGLQKGVYIAKATIDGKESTSKFTKK